MEMLGTLELIMAGFCLGIGFYIVKAIVAAVVAIGAAIIAYCRY